MNLAYLSLGSNIDPERNLARAVEHLREAGELRAVSTVYETEPQGRADQPNFLNAAVLLATTLDAGVLKGRVIAGIEKALGRVRDPEDKNAPRTIDVDIAIWVPGGAAGIGDAMGGGDAAAEGGAGSHASVFSPEIPRWAHVAVPLAEIAPDLVPAEGGRSLAELAAELSATAHPPRARPDITLTA